MKTETIAGIEYELPRVFLMQSGSIGVAEFAGRTAYDSFDNSEHKEIKELNNSLLAMTEPDVTSLLEDVENIESSELMNTLTWVYHHGSVAEHVNLTFLIKGTSRGVLQELARHRIASYTVRSTRYTMGTFLNAYMACGNDRQVFIKILNGMDLFVVRTKQYKEEILSSIFMRLLIQENITGSEEFKKLTTSKSSLEILDNQDLEPVKKFNLLQKGKQKRNVGDNFKHIVDDNWKVDLVMTINLRSLQNFMKLRDSGSAYFQIRWLAQEMKKVIPKHHMNLIVKER